MAATTTTATDVSVTVAMNSDVQAAGCFTTDDIDTHLCMDVDVPACLLA